MATKTCMRCGSLMDEFDTKCPCGDPPRASRMPAHMASVDPAYIEALSAPVPEEAVKEKLPERARRAGL